MNIKTLSVLTALSLSALSGCHNTWNGVREDGSRILGRSIGGIGQGIGKAGAALERTGERIDNNTPNQTTEAQPVPYPEGY